MGEVGDKPGDKAANSTPKDPAKEPAKDPTKDQETGAAPAPKLQTPASSESKKLEAITERFKGVEKELADLKSRHSYMVAEFANYKNQALKERELLMRFGAEPVARDLLEVLDNFERALDIKDSKDFKSLKQGVSMIAQHLEKVLQQHGVKKRKSGPGDAFDPELHEALGTIECSDTPEGHVAKVYKPAYFLHQRLLRPAQVMVARNTTQAPSKGAGGEASLNNAAPNKASTDKASASKQAAEAKQPVPPTQSKDSGC